MNDTVKKVIVLSLVVLLCTLVNFAGSCSSGFVWFPLYLDSLLTILAAVYGLVPSLLVAVLSEILVVLYIHANPLYTICQLLTAVGAWLIFRKKERPLSIDDFMWSGILSAVTNGYFGSLLSVHLYGGISAFSQVNNAVQGLYAILRNMTAAVYIGGFLTNLVDKAISGLVSYLMYKLLRKCPDLRNY